MRKRTGERKKLTPRQKKLLILLTYFLVGLIIWEVFLAYVYFALPVWGVGFLTAIHWGLQSLQGKHPKLTFFLRGTLAVVLAASFAFFCYVESLVVSGSRGAENPECDYVLVLGAAVRGETPSRSLTERLQAALGYLNTYPDAKCVVSGGKGWGENLSEAECMSRWLVEHGVDPERVILEDRATSTWENLNFTLDLIEEATGESPTRLAVVSSEYHLYRAELMAESLQVEFLGVPAVTHPWLNRIHYFFREFFGVVHYWVLGN